MSTTNKSIGVFIDGGYFAKINEALHEQISMNISMNKFFKFVREEVARIHNIPVEECIITENHYFRGRYRVNDANNKKLLFSERKFEDSLIENDVIFHYKHLREIDGNVIEKGIDVWYALEAYELAAIRKFDYVVLITGDADHEMLARKLKALKTHVILLTWDPANTASTSRFLKEEVCEHYDMNTLIAADPSLLNRLTK